MRFLLAAIFLTFSSLASANTQALSQERADNVRRTSFTLFLYSQVIYDYINEGENYYQNTFRGKLTRKVFGDKSYEEFKKNRVYLIEFLKTWERLASTGEYSLSLDIFEVISRGNTQLAKSFEIWDGIHGEFKGWSRKSINHQEIYRPKFIDAKLVNLGNLRQKMLFEFLQSELISNFTDRYNSLIDKVHFNLMVSSGGSMFADGDLVFQGALAILDIFANTPGFSEKAKTLIDNRNSTLLAATIKSALDGRSVESIGLIASGRAITGGLGIFNARKLGIFLTKNPFNTALGTSIVGHIGVVAYFSSAKAADFKYSERTTKASITNVTGEDTGYIGDLLNNAEKQLIAIKSNPQSAYVGRKVVFYNDLYMEPANGANKRGGLTTQQWEDLYENIYREARTAALRTEDFVDQLTYVRKAILPYFENYRADEVRMTTLINGEGANCVSQTKLLVDIFSRLIEEGIVKTDRKLGVEIFTNHIAPVFYDPKKSTVSDLVYGKLKTPVTPIYHPNILLTGVLKRYDRKPPVSTLDLLILDVENVAKETKDEYRTDPRLVRNMYPMATKKSGDASDLQGSDNSRRKVEIAKTSTELDENFSSGTTFGAGSPEAQKNRFEIRVQTNTDPTTHLSDAIVRDAYVNEYGRGFFGDFYLPRSGKLPAPLTSPELPSDPPSSTSGFETVMDKGSMRSKTNKGTRLNGVFDRDKFYSPYDDKGFNKQDFVTTHRDPEKFLKIAGAIHKSDLGETFISATTQDYLNWLFGIPSRNGLQYEFNDPLSKSLTSVESEARFLSALRTAYRYNKSFKNGFLKAWEYPGYLDYISNDVGPEKMIVDKVKEQIWTLLETKSANLIQVISLPLGMSDKTKASTYYSAIHGLARALVFLEPQFMRKDGSYAQWQKYAITNSAFAYRIADPHQVAIATNIIKDDDGFYVSGGGMRSQHVEQGDGNADTESNGPVAEISPPVVGAEAPAYPESFWTFQNDSGVKQQGVGFLASNALVQRKNAPLKLPFSKFLNIVQVFLHVHPYEPSPIYARLDRNMLQVYKEATARKYSYLYDMHIAELAKNLAVISESQKRSGIPTIQKSIDGRLLELTEFAWVVLDEALIIQNDQKRTFTKINVRDTVEKIEKDTPLIVQLKLRQFDRWEAPDKLILKDYLKDLRSEDLEPKSRRIDLRWNKVELDFRGWTMDADTGLLMNDDTFKRFKKFNKAKTGDD